MGVNSLLPDDVFQNEHSRHLFDAIDRLRTCGASQDLELPEVTFNISPTTAKLILLACYRWGPVCRQVIASSEFNRYPFPSRQQRMHSFSYTYYFTENPRITCDDNDSIN